ncbi:hypothetical protein [Flavobacterium panacagri]|uniref:hypothetical protein n=1 Tax=Flavobacterium panacagri TaxID=3034146 RepID=UPI0025A52BA3|nr:hypothetical protein [Flavobacterium panacagri]
MKIKITFAVLFCFFVSKTQGQASINESKRDNSFADVLLSEEYKQVVTDIANTNEKVEDLNKKLAAKNALVKNDIVDEDIKAINAALASNNSRLKSLMQLKASFREKEEQKQVYVVYYDKQIDNVKNEIDSLKNAIRNHTSLKEIELTQDRINKKEREIRIIEQEKTDKLLSLNTYRWFMPTLRKIDRAVFFKDMYSNKTDKTILLNSFALSSDSKASAVQTEIVTDNLSALRLSFGSVVSLSTSKDETEETAEQKKKEETEQEAFSRLINGGGNFYLEAVLPLLCTNPNNGNQFTFYGYGSIRGAMDVEGFGNDIDTSTANYAIGLNTYFGLSSDSKKFNFFVQANGTVSGGTNDFYKNLGLVHEKAFFNGKIIAGMTILNNFRFSAMLSAYGSDEKIRSNKITVGIQILPGL